MNHYLLPDGPVAIQFSGGRTSGYMLWHILDAYGGKLPQDCHVLFQNTGREMPQTLDFVARCGAEWGVEIVWLEFDPETGWKRVGPGTNIPASTNGEPFEALIRSKGFLPNQHLRWCTQHLKVRPSKHYMADWCGYDHWHAAIGIRADEAHRTNSKSSAKERHDCIYPLAAAGVTKRDVVTWWQMQPFDLELPTYKGKTALGNCDGCFLKSERARAFLARYHPERAAWWARMEALVSETAKTGSAARFDRRITWASLIDHAERQADWVFDQGGELYCGATFGGCHD